MQLKRLNHTEIKVNSLNRLLFVLFSRVCKQLGPELDLFTIDAHLRCERPDHFPVKDQPLALLKLMLSFSLFKKLLQADPSVGELLSSGHREHEAHVLQDALNVNNA